MFNIKVSREYDDKTFIVDNYFDDGFCLYFRDDNGKEYEIEKTEVLSVKYF